jgi:uncharacterized protein YeaO (DUF488 family)
VARTAAVHHQRKWFGHDPARWQECRPHDEVLNDAVVLRDVLPGR